MNAPPSASRIRPLPQGDGSQIHPTDRYALTPEGRRALALLALLPRTPGTGGATDDSPAQARPGRAA